MFRIGIEEEMLLLDAKTKEPVYLSMVDCQKIFGDKLFLEKFSCQLEYRSIPCANICALKDELTMVRDFLDKAAEDVGCQLMRLALHPFFN
jgi:gamma-glutamyl:cysteine ligase YbdK (ATP-grasp superfamily)